MPAWLVPFASLIGVVVGFALGAGRDALKDRREKRKRQARVRRLLAHHATTLVEDARVFLATSERCASLPEPEIAVRFADVTTSEHVYRDQIAERIDDLSDELITLFRDLDLAASAAAHAVDTLKRWSGTFFGTRQLDSGFPITARTIPTTLTEELGRATIRHRELRDVALTTLKRIVDERATLPVQSQRLLAPGTGALERRADRKE